MSSNNEDVRFWDKHREKIYSSIGGWFGGKDVQIHGHSMMTELLGHASYMQVIVLNSTGRLIDEKLASWLEGNFIGMSYPDARIWCNQIGALSGAARTSVTAATVAGALAGDSRAYGGSKTALQGMVFIQSALNDYKLGSTVENIIAGVNKNRNQQPIITGYARPVNKNDERLKPHEIMSDKLGFEVGEHLSLAYEISECLQVDYNLGMNIGGYTSAFLSDAGFTPEEVYQIKCMVVSSGVTACYINSKNRPADSFQPLRCDDVQYTGHKPRNFPTLY